MSTAASPCPGHEGWGICGVGLIDSPAERAKAEGMAAQDGLYTLSLFPPQGEPTSSVVGAIVEYLFAPADPAAVLARLRDPAIRIVSLTVTEGGYNLDEATGAFRLDAPDVAHDLAHPEAPRTVFGFIVAALAQRRADGLPAVHRAVLRQSPAQWRGRSARRVLAFAGARDPELADWIAANATFPSCMVDRITPGGDAGRRGPAERATGVDDQLPIFAEDFIQWVVEDRFCAGRPALEQVGVQFTDDVGGLRAGQAAHAQRHPQHALLPGPAGRLPARPRGDGRPAHPRLSARLPRPRRDPAADRPAGHGARATIATPCWRRFANPAVKDQLLRITSDGASKIPVFLGDTLRGLPRARAATTGGSPSCSPPSPTISAARDDRGAAFTPLEPHLTAADRALAADPDPAAVAADRHASRAWGWSRRAAFAASFARYRAPHRRATGRWRRWRPIAAEGRAERMYLEKYDLKGRVAVVTGGGQGIGFACAQALGEAGAKVVVAEHAAGPGRERRRPSSRGWASTPSACRSTSPSRRRSTRSRPGSSASTGRPHILVNNAGVAKSDVRAEDTSDEHWRFHMDVNLDGLFWCCRAFGRQMLAAGRGSIVNIGSMSGVHRQQAAAAGVLQRVQGRRAPPDQVARLRVGASAACG